MIKYANNLERTGKLFDAFKANIESMTVGNRNSPLYKQALLNNHRILTRLKGRERIEANELLKEYETSLHRDEVVLSERRKEGLHSYSTLPLVTIIVPCYNCEDYLPETIRSIIAQTYKRIEVILVDDYSTDNSVNISRTAAKQDKRFRFYQHRANGGLASARNTGIRLAKGEFICFLDSDDLLSVTSIEKRVKMLFHYKHFEFVAGVFDQSINIPDNYSGPIKDNEITVNKDYVDFITAAGDCPFNANQPMIKRPVLMDLGGFPENYPQAEDWRLWSKALRTGYVFIPVKSIGSGYRQTKNSMIRRSPLVHLGKSFRNYIRVNNAFTEENDHVEVDYENRFYAKPLFIEAHGLYAARQRFLPRLINFLGIEYARCIDNNSIHSIDNATQEVLNLIPDISLVFSGYTRRNVIDWFEKGYKRYWGVDTVSNQDQEYIDRYLIVLLDRLGLDKKSLQVGQKKIIIPTRRIIRNYSERVDIVFIPHKEYHSRSIELLLPYLSMRGLTYKFIDITIPYRNENARIADHERNTLSYNEFVLSRCLPNIIVCMNDWDTVVKPLVRKANENKIPTIGIVEGVQDYHDADTGRKRNPYCEVEHVFLPGPFDRRYFNDTKQKLYDIGIQRLEGLEKYIMLRRKKPNKKTPVVVLNVNFSYGVLVDRRKQWVADVAAACELAGYHLLISQHPQDNGNLAEYEVEKRPLYELLVEANFFISRFSGAIFESLVIGCPVIYYNGHHEKVDKFLDSHGAYDIAESVEELTFLLRKGPNIKHDTSRFLEEHCCIRGVESKSVIERTVDTIADIVRDAPKDIEKMENFKRMLLL